MKKGELLTVEAVAERLQISRETVWRYIRAGQLRALLLPGGSYRVRERDLEKMLLPKAGS